MPVTSLVLLPSVATMGATLDGDGRHVVGEVPLRRIYIDFNEDEAFSGPDNDGEWSVVVQTDLGQAALWVIGIRLNVLGWVDEVSGRESVDGGRVGVGDDAKLGQRGFRRQGLASVDVQLTAADTAGSPPPRSNPFHTSETRYNCPHSSIPRAANPG